jgi:hypothetical protein
MGAEAVLDRFRQIELVLLFCEAGGSVRARGGNSVAVTVSLGVAIGPSG